MLLHCSTSQAHTQTQHGSRFGASKCKIPNIFSLLRAQVGDWFVERCEHQEQLMAVKILCSCHLLPKPTAGTAQYSMLSIYCTPFMSSRSPGAYERRPVSACSSHPSPAFPLTCTNPHSTLPSPPNLKASRMRMNPLPIHSPPASSRIIYPSPLTHLSSHSSCGEQPDTPSVRYLPQCALPVPVSAEV
jgi:hypothetical protein